MIIGYKYFLSEDKLEGGTINIDNSVESFNSTMSYKELDLNNSEDYSRLFLGGIEECHKALIELLNKDKLIVGLGSGYGEHEFMLHKKGYDIIASYIIPGLGKSLIKVDKKFRHLTIDVFKDDVKSILKDNLSINRDYDILMSGLDAYFDDDQLIYLLNRINILLSKNSKLIFVLSYRDYLFAKLIEFILKIEGKILSTWTGKKLIKKAHGYRRSHNEIVNLASQCGFKYEKKTANIFRI